MTLSNRLAIASVVNLIFLSGFPGVSDAHADFAPVKVLVLPFEIERGATVPGAPQKEAAEAARLVVIAGRLRDAMTASGQFAVSDGAAVRREAEAANLQACGNCAADFARQVGARYAVTGLVHKVSELILSINVYVSDARTSQRVTAASVDLRGNTDESWRRGIDYLWRNVLSKRMKGLPE